MTRLEATAAHEDLCLEIALFPFEPFAARVWELRRNLTSYDSWYVAVAEALELPFASLDRRLSRATGPRCRFLLPA
ncbi:MAG TPA: type II toxin-antitoxin system VapC family toxin [Thermoanaerobaculia bacterium]|nr:type II toxin-antitoxin system VapC family toxin [Thermoanaerobaculia bacterium]